MARDLYQSTGIVKGGVLQLRNSQAFKSAMQELKDGEVFVTVQRARATRSLAQNAYYWGVVVELISEDSGHTPDEIHEYLKQRFLPKRLAIANGNGVVAETEPKGLFRRVAQFLFGHESTAPDTVVIGGSTTRLNKIEFGEYVSDIQRWAAEELDIVMPDPHEREELAS